MPELPEVETVRTFLEEKLNGRTLVSVRLFVDKAFKNFVPADLHGKKIIGVRRHGKYLLVDLASKQTLLSHLRMEGRYRITDAERKDLKHVTAVFTFDNGLNVYYEDSRKFGTFHLYPSLDILQTKELKKVGNDPLAENFDEQPFLEALARSRKKIKTFLLDQSYMSGIGNIYADEILFAARVHPERTGLSVTAKEATRIVAAAKKILTDAVKLKGTTIDTYKFDGITTGGYQHFLKVHMQKNHPCPICGEPVVKIKVNGRGTYFCRKCQV